MFAFWSLLLTLLVSGLALTAEEPEFVEWIVLGAYVSLGAVFVRTMRSARDILNPFSVIVLLGTIRFTIPWLLVSSGVESRNTLFLLMGLGPDDWHRGELLALVGLLAFALGWVLVSDRGVSRWRITFALPAGVPYSAIAGMAIGLTALLAFLGSNAGSIFAAVLQGNFRGTAIKEGTGAFFYLALLLPASSIVLSSFWLARGRKLLALGAVGVSTLGFFILGGRARAAMAILAWVVLIWYLNRSRSERSRGSTARSRVGFFLIATAISLVILYVGAVYRGNPRLPEGALVSPAGVEAYASFGFMLDVGHLHPLAASTAIGSGVLGGKSLIGAMTFPLTEVIGLSQVGSGIFIVEETLGFRSASARQWGFNASLMGDAYLNFGVVGVILLCGILGLALKAAYRAFREGSLPAAIYAIVIIYAVRITFESIEKWGELLTVVAFALAVIHTSLLFSARPSAQPTDASSRPSGIGSGPGLHR